MYTENYYDPNYQPFVSQPDTPPDDPIEHDVWDADWQDLRFEREVEEEMEKINSTTKNDSNE